HWTRNIAAFSGLVATQQQGSQAVIELSDLQGNVVGTASSSEAAGRPLAMERSSTFGEPTSGKPVDKLKWLGTAGVSSELPGGAIAKDGITYVPQLGQALQTTSTTVPSPDNTATAYVSSLGPGANALAQAASAQETTIYQEATRKAEEAQIAAQIASETPSQGEATENAEPGGLEVTAISEQAPSGGGEGPIATAADMMQGGGGGGVPVGRLTVCCKRSKAKVWCKGHYGGKRAHVEAHLSTGDRIVEGFSGAAVAVAAGGALYACSVASVAADDPLLALHCAGPHGGIVLAGASAVVNALFE
ncbi:MAG: hypothetical protein ACYCST_21750, partial [Acidimicrobiales bacterium]